MISLDVAPFFYALSRNYGSMEEDHLVAYEEGHLTLAAKNVYEAILREGPLDSISLRKAGRMSGAKESAWNRALEDLQLDFKILPVGVAEAGAWRYAFIYEIVARHYPELPKRARPIGESAARRRLIQLYVNSVGALRQRDIGKLFGWSAELSGRAVGGLIQEGEVTPAENPQAAGDWLALPSICD